MPFLIYPFFAFVSIIYMVFCRNLIKSFGIFTVQRITNIPVFTFVAGLIIVNKNYCIVILVIITSCFIYFIYRHVE